MRIFYFFKELNTPMYQWQRLHIIDELSHYNHEITTYNPLDFPTIAEANKNVIDTLKKSSNYDLFLACDDSDTIYCETILKVKMLGIPTCLICWDNLELPYKQKKIAPHFDVVWLTSIETKYLFEKWGCKNIIFQTYAANPFKFIPTWDNATINEVGFIGSPYGSRTNKLNDLTDNNIPCRVYSDSLFKKSYNTSVGYEKFDLKDISVKTIRYLKFPIGRKVLYSTLKNKFIEKKNELKEHNGILSKYHSVDHEKMCSLYSTFSLSLNITELRDTYILKSPIHKIHLRAFEIPMCGGLQIASYNDELAQYFEENKEIVLYHDIQEMIEKCRFYTNPKNYQLVLHMKNAARKRAEAEHTWRNRFEVVFKSL